MATWTRETIGLEISSTSLTVDNIKIDGTTIGHTDDTDLLTLASGALTVTGTITSTGTITGTLATAAQTNITSLGTLTALQIDNINLNTNTINATSGDLTITAAGGDISFGDDNLATTGNLDIDGITNLDAVDIDGAVQLDGTLTVGVSDTGYDVKFFGATANSYWLWDQSNNRVRQVGTGQNSFRIETSLASSAVGPGLHLYRNSPSPSGSGGDYDTVGAISFLGTNATDGTDSEVQYSRIRSRILDATKDAEEGEFNIHVRGNGTATQAFAAFGQSDGTADVTIAYGAASVTTIAGDLTVTGGNITVTGAPSYTATTQTARNADTASTAGALQDVVQTLIDDLQTIGILQ